MLVKKEDDGSWMMSILTMHQCTGPSVNRLRVLREVERWSVLNLVRSVLAASDEVAGEEDFVEEGVLVEEPVELGTWTCSWRW